MKDIRRYRKQIYAISVLLIIIMLQSTLMNSFRIIFNVKPDTILAALIFFVPFFNLGWVVTFAFLGGIFRDIFSLLPFGFNIFICVIWVILAKQISRRLPVENNLIRCAMLCLIILLNNLVIYSILFLLNRPIAMIIFLKTVPIESILTLLLGIPMYRFFVYLFMDGRR